MSSGINTARQVLGARRLPAFPARASPAWHASCAAGAWRALWSLTGAFPRHAAAGTNCAIAARPWSVHPPISPPPGGNPHACFAGGIPRDEDLARTYHADVAAWQVGDKGCLHTMGAPHAVDESAQESVHNFQGRRYLAPDRFCDTKEREFLEAGESLPIPGRQTGECSRAGGECQPARR